MNAVKCFLALIVCIVAVGCSDSPTGKLDQDYMKSGEQIGTQRREIFLRSNGDYDAISAEDKAAYLKSFDGKEANARNFWEMMKNPPSSSGPLGPGQAPK